MIADWVADAVPELAGPLLDLYESQLDQTVIGWSISIDRDAAAYMRITDHTSGSNGSTWAIPATPGSTPTPSTATS